MSASPHEPDAPTPPEQENGPLKDLPGAMELLTLGTMVAIIIAVFVVMVSGPTERGGPRRGVF